MPVPGEFVIMRRAILKRHPQPSINRSTRESFIPATCLIFCGAGMRTVSHCVDADKSGEWV
jgi:hypothetical protein